jgi:ketosteroid isomerase-like protein
MNIEIARKYSFVILSVLLVFTSLAHSAPAADDGKAAVKAANAQFYAALNALFTGEVDPMKKVWSHAGGSTYMGPAGGLEVGWKRILASWESQAAMKLGGSVQPKDIHLVVGADLAVVQNYEEGTNINAKGKAAMVSIRATNIFRKENGAWKMIGHHTDLLPYLQKK